MKTKKLEPTPLTINCPDGYEIDIDKSDLFIGVIEFKEVENKLTYTDIIKKLFKNDECVYYFIEHNNSICIHSGYFGEHLENDNDLSKTKEQLESILALNKLCNVAKYLNGDWLPKRGREKSALCVNVRNEIRVFTSKAYVYNSDIYFKSEKLAQQAINILGEEEIKKALTLNH